MAIVTISSSSEPDANSFITTNLYRAPVWFGDEIVADPGQMVLIGSNGYGALYGGAFTYSSTGRASGQVFSFEFAVGASQSESGAYSANTQYQFSELNGTNGLSAEKLYQFGVNGNSTGALKYLLSRNDVIYGSGFDNYSVDEILYGWGGKDKIYGVDGNDIIGGGAGRDTLVGGNGEDYFFIDSIRPKDADKIVDFGFGGVRDKIVLQQSAFGDLALGELLADQFVVGTAAADADDRIILNAGKVYYDADGNGAGMAVMIAKVAYAEVVPTGVLQLSAGDFRVVDALENIVLLASL